MSISHFSSIGQQPVPDSAGCDAGLSATAAGRESLLKLEQIGFYTLSDQRAQNASCGTQMMRGEIIITEYCNFKCPYCRGLKPEVFGERAQKQLSFDEVKRIIDCWCDGPSGLPIKNIRFSGGEPTLHKNIVEIIAYAIDGLGSLRVGSG